MFCENTKYKSYKGEVGKICNNLLNREFEAKNQMRNGLQM